MHAEAVPAQVVGERMARLTEVVERGALDRNQDRLGRREEVLVEGPSKKDPSRRSGRTRQGKLLHFDADPSIAPAGALVEVTVTHAAPHWLAGELRASPLEAPPRVRIPVTAA
jgi:tRNA-2-methylthio-N6-dimethylallyladenosine synthase